ncbi:MAG: hypothetical protein V9H26_22445 [Verrucomicrobiota bacterium]
MNGLKKSLGLALSTAFVTVSSTTASLPLNLARSAKAPVTSEFSGQYRPDHKPMNPL